MKRTEFIGITSGVKGTRLGSLVFLLLKNYGFKVGLVKDRLVKVNEKVVKQGITDSEDIEKIFNDEEDFDYVILDNLKLNCLYDLVKKYTMDIVMDEGVIRNEKLYDKNRKKSKLMLDNLKRNGISIINSDNKVLFDHFNRLRDKIIITYGLNGRSTITASSVDIGGNITFNCCIQRGITTLRGNEIELMEFPIKTRYYDNFNICYFLAAIGLALIYEIPIVNIQKSICKLKENDFM